MIVIHKSNEAEEHEGQEDPGNPQVANGTHETDVSTQKMNAEGNAAGEGEMYGNE